MPNETSAFSARDAGKSRPSASAAQAERELARRLRQTRADVRRVDLVSALCAYATLGLALLFIGVLLDHWILSRGLSERGRVLFAIFWIGATSFFLIIRIIPVLRRRVNALYAAKVMEDAALDRHNLIISWMQLSGDAGRRRKDRAGDQEDAARREAVELVTLQAAASAQRRSEDVALDFSSVIRWGVAFAALVAVCALYAVLSPKNMFVSIGRIAAPTADIARPQALSVEDVEPGNTEAYLGDFVAVSATVPGAGDSSVVEMLYSTEDGRLTDLALPMTRDAGSRFSVNFPEGEDGIAESVNYCVVVARGGRFESRSETFHIDARPQPSFRVEKTELVFPDYTGMAPQTFDQQGEIRALEGTQVKITARSNVPIARAFLFPDGEQTRAVKMTVSPDDPTRAETQFALNWKDPDAEDRRPEFSFYRIQAENENGEKNRDQTDYPVSIIPDLPPEIAWLAEESTESDAVEIPVNDVLRIQFATEDPDYSLRRVILQLEHAAPKQGDQNDSVKKNPDPIELALKGAHKDADYAAGPTPFAGRMTVSYDLVPEKLGLRPGDEIEYWGVAFDSKLPSPNVAATERRIFTVVDPVAAPQQPQTQPEDEEENPEDSMEQNGSGEGAGEGSEQNQDQSGNGQNSGNESSESSDGSNSQENGESGADASAQPEQGDEGDADDSESGGAGEAAGASRQDEESEEGASSRNQASGGSDENGGSDDSDAGDQSESGESSGSSEGADASDEEGDNAESSQSPGAQSPKEGEPNDAADAQDAFEKILGLMSREEDAEGAEGEGASGDDETAEDQEQSGGQGGKNRENRDQEGNARDAEEETDPDFDSDRNLPSPEEKRELPTRTSPDRPSEDSPVYQATPPQDAPETTNIRESDDVDDDSHDYLAQNASPDAETTDQSDPDANISLNPADTSPATAADAPDPNAREAKGKNGADLSGTPSEIDRDGDNPRGNGGAEPDDFNGNDVSSGGADSSLGNDPLQSGAPSGSDGDGGRGSQQDPKGDSRGGGASGDSQTPDSKASGGGGSGLGELDAQEYSLAPADSPKLAYAEEATNLALAYIEDSLRRNEAGKLMKELGWTEEELRDFLEKWQSMRDAARKRGGAAAKREYLEALGELGLTPRESMDDERGIEETREKTDLDDRQRDGGRQASRLKTPERMEERVRAFSRGISKRTPSKSK